MNIFNKFLTILAGCLAAANLICWDGKLIKISKGNKSCGFMIRQYARTDWENVGKCLDLEGFRCRQVSNYERHWEKISGNTCQDMYAIRELPVMASPYDLYIVGKKILNNELKIYESNEFSKLKPWDHLTSIFIGDIGNTGDQEEGEYILDTVRLAFKKIAAEDASIKYEEIPYKNGQPVISMWSRFKSFIFNEKFLYSVGAVSALYLTYEYLKQR